VKVDLLIEMDEVFADFVVDRIAGRKRIVERSDESGK